jgi:predicted peptidase
MIHSVRLITAGAASWVGLLGCLGLAIPGTAWAQNKTSTQLQALFQARSFTSAQVSMVYRLYVPANYDPAQKYPLVVALHGVGERGNNNVNQLTAEELAQPWVRDSVQAKHPHFVMIPQCPSTDYWWPFGGPRANPWNGVWIGTRSNANLGVVQILDSLKREFSLDTTRFYATGLSMGGFGTMELMKHNPTLFAATVPTAAGGDTSAVALSAYAQTPFWLFHSATDPNIPVDAGARLIARTFEAHAGAPLVRFVSDTGMTNPTAITVDSLRKAVYVAKANYLYSEVRNVPGSGNTLHQAGWFAAYRHPMMTDWVFSKQKVNGVTVAVNSALALAPPGGAKINLVVAANGNVLLERRGRDGLKTFHTLDGKRLIQPESIR